MTTETTEPRPVLLTTGEVAKLLRVSEQHVRRLRVRKQGPPSIKLPSGSIRYRVEDVEAWIGGAA